MALFKIYRGNAENLPAALHDGYAYFVIDTGDFYIDAMSANNQLQRTLINPKAKRMTQAEIEEQADTIIKDGQIIIYPDNNIKIGDGVTTLANLPIISEGQTITLGHGDLIGASDTPGQTMTVGGEIFNIYQGQNKNVASGDYSHAEGFKTIASGGASHAEGSRNRASGSCSHAEGSFTTASGNGSHAEGYNTTASGYASHAEGNITVASGYYSHAQNENTIAAKKAQTAIGRFNLEDASTVSDYGKYAFVIGNGTSASRSNAMTVDWDGTVTAADFVKSDGSSIGGGLTREIYRIDVSAGANSGSYNIKNIISGDTINYTLDNATTYTDPDDGRVFTVVTLISSTLGSEFLFKDKYAIITPIAYDDTRPFLTKTEESFFEKLVYTTIDDATGQLKLYFSEYDPASAAPSTLNYSLQLIQFV